MTMYYRPLAQHGLVRPNGAVPLAGGASWFTHAECLSRSDIEKIVPTSELPDGVLARLTQPRAPIAGLDLAQTRVMGILNATPDSFSDGGLHVSPAAALERGQAMVQAGADILDVGGESTRPGARLISAADETARTAPVIAALKAALPDTCVSIDSRKADVTQSAFDAGADLANDVSGLSFDAEMAGLIAQTGAPICIMHAQGTPDTMQENPTYTNVLLDVYDALERQIRVLEALGVSRDKIIVDPGIGFGKTQTHNLTLLKGVSLYHGLGCAILLGVSRKKFIGTIGRAPDPQTRAPGSIALALDAVRQGVQVLRVHDVEQTCQALALWRAVSS